MYPFADNLSLMRYLLVLKIRTALVLVNPNFSIELSVGLSSIVSQRMFGAQASTWKKKLALFSSTPLQNTSGNSDTSFPTSFWPVEVAFLACPAKIRYSREDLLLCELKLFGAVADHDFFLETILPALEQSSMESAPPIAWKSHLWGNFDLEAIFVGHADRWEAVVENGRLDFRVWPDATQWQKEAPGAAPARRYKTLTWITPVCLPQAVVAPQMVGIIEALFMRISQLTGKSYHTFRQYLANLAPAEIQTIQRIVGVAEKARLQKQHELPLTVNVPNAWQGIQHYQRIPEALLPYLNLASILHVGNYTHFGCGTFYLT
jgi:hypothetical protein